VTLMALLVSRNHWTLAEQLWFWPLSHHHWLYSFLTTLLLLTWETTLIGFISLHRKPCFVAKRSRTAEDLGKEQVLKSSISIKEKSSTHIVKLRRRVFLYRDEKPLSLGTEIKSDADGVETDPTLLALKIFVSSLCFCIIIIYFTLCTTIGFSRSYRN
jgi:hypothetical protein